MAESAHLARAKEFIAIAESGDAKREAYKAATEEIAAHLDEKPNTKVTELASSIGKERHYVAKLLKWRENGYPEGTTPFTMSDGSGPSPTERAAKSHTRKVLTEADPATIEDIIGTLPWEQRQAIADAALPERKRAREFAQTRTPAPVDPRGDLNVFKISGNLATMRRLASENLHLAAEVDQPGDDEDLIDDFNKVIGLTEAGLETYKTGKSVDTWAAELAAGAD